MYQFMHHLKRKPVANYVMKLHENFFFPIDHLDADIRAAEEAFNIKLPSQLKFFYDEIGWGQLQMGANGLTADYNYIAAPAELVEIHNGTSGWLMPYSVLEPESLPFLQRGVDSFLCLKPKSDNPNAIWWMWGELMPHSGKICDSLVEFFQRLVADPNWFNPPQK
jgi:SMI1 / KNR4 family (SUKH-1)